MAYAGQAERLRANRDDAFCPRYHPWLDRDRDF